MWNLPNTVSRNQKGLTIAEVVIGIFIISITVAGVVVSNSVSLQSYALTGDNLIASNLAYEGLEATRSIRDSNWLFYSGSKRSSDSTGARDAWNEGFDGTDSFGTIYRSGFYTATFPINEYHTDYFLPEIDLQASNAENRFQWKLRHIASHTGEKNKEDLADYALNNSSYIVYQQESSALYLHNNSFLNPNSIGYKPTKFRRFIEITYRDSKDGNTNINAKDNIVRIRSIVAWKDYQGNNQSIVLENTLSDWFRREDKQ